MVRLWMPRLKSSGPRTMCLRHGMSSAWRECSIGRGVDLSPEMVRVARRDYPGFAFDVTDVRELVSSSPVVTW